MYLRILVTLAGLLICSVCDAYDPSKYCSQYINDTTMPFHQVVINNCYKKKCYKGVRYDRNEPKCVDKSLPKGHRCVKNEATYLTYDKESQTCTLKECVATNETSELKQERVCNEIVYYNGKEYQSCISNEQRFYVKNALTGDDTMCSCENGKPTNCNLLIQDVKTYLDTKYSEPEMEKVKKRKQKQKKRQKKIGRQQRRYRRRYQG